MALRGYRNMPALILSAGIFFAPWAVRAQTTITGSITGLVRDVTGAVVPSVNITARNEATNLTYAARSSATGNYAVPDLPVGNYAVTALLSGFKTWTRSNILVTGGEAVRIDVVMTVGEVAERIEVTGATPALQTESTQV